MSVPSTHSPIRKKKIEGQQLAGIQYVGVAGSSKDCQDAVLRYIQFGDHITNVDILTNERDHCLLLTIGVGDRVAVKSGFASGYGGEGPRRFSYVLQVLDNHGSEIEEYDVAEDFLERVDSSSLTRRDLEFLTDANNHRPTRWHDYVQDREFTDAKNGTLWHREFPSILPLAVIDPRIMDLALEFWVNTDNSLLVGYRRLEDIVRTRTGIEEYGTKLFSKTFNPKDGLLTWKDTDEGERAGRLNLFTGTYGAHRNRRAHSESKTYSEESSAEFLLLNHLYRLEKEAVKAKDSAQGKLKDPGTSENPGFRRKSLSS